MLREVEGVDEVVFHGGGEVFRLPVSDAAVARQRSLVKALPALFALPRAAVPAPRVIGVLAYGATPSPRGRRPPGGAATRRRGGGRWRGGAGGGGQGVQRDGPAEPGIGAWDHRPHAAGPELLDDLVGSDSLAKHGPPPLNTDRSGR